MPENPSSKMTASTGTHVVVELLDAAGEIQRLEFDIVPDKMADFSRGFLGEGTPLARLIRNQPAGALLPFRTEETLQVRILSVDVARSWPAEDSALPRQEAMRKAQQQVERANAILFASSFSGKWGDYDPSGIDHWDEPGESDDEHQ